MSSLFSAVSVFLGVVRPIPLFMAKALEASLTKAKTQKYIRKVPIPGKFTKTGKPRYRYFYRTVGGKGLGHHEEIVTGAAFKMRDGGEHGHFHVVHDHGDGRVTIKHDETGKEHKIHRDALAAMLHNEHAEVRKQDDAAAAAKREKAKKQALADMEEAKKHGSAKHVEAARKRAVAAGHVEEKMSARERFESVYAKHIAKDQPHLSEADVKKRAKLMLDAVERGAASWDGPSMRATAKELGVKLGMASLADHLTDGAYSRRVAEAKKAKEAAAAHRASPEGKAEATAKRLQALASVNQKKADKLSREASDAAEAELRDAAATPEDLEASAALFKRPAEREAGAKAEKKPEVDAVRNAVEAASNVKAALSAAAPNGRDYYVQEAGAFDKARDQLEDAQEIIAAVEQSLRALYYRQQGYGEPRPGKAVDVAKLKPVKGAVYPMPHLNGTGKADLLKQFAGAAEAAKKLRASLDGIQGMDHERALIDSVIAEYEHGAKVIEARIKGDPDPARADGAKGEKPKAEAKSLHVPMTKREAEVTAYRQALTRDVDQAIERVRNDSSLDKIGDARAMLISAIKGADHRATDRSFGKVAERIFATRAFKSIPREQRPPVVAAVNKAIEEAWPASMSSIALYGAYNQNGSDPAYEASKAHRERVYQHIRSTVGADTANWLQANPAVLGSVALGEIKDTADLANALNKHSEDYAKTAREHAEALEGVHGKITSHEHDPFDMAGVNAQHTSWHVQRSGEIDKASRELAALGHDMSGVEKWKKAAADLTSAHSKVASKRASLLEKRNEAERKKREAERTNTEKAREAQRKARPQSLTSDEVAKFNEVTKKAAPLPDKPISAHANAKPKAIDVKRLSDFTSKDLTRANIGGIHADGKMAYATDGHRAVMVPTNERTHVRVDKKGKEIGRHRVGADGWTYEPDDELKKNADVPEHHRRADQFPDINRIMPQEHGIASTHTFDAQSLHALANAAKAHHKANGDKLPRVAFKRTTDGKVHAEIVDTEAHEKGAPDIKVEGKTHMLPEKLDRESESIHVNAKYLQDAVAGHKGPVTIRFMHDGQFSPIDIHRPDGERHVVMPMRS